ncbi:MAG: glycosyltransferase family 4 protein [Planctomycetes bacterium]|nr:glycosyltransferase family 4 protein [Planctomycetota bacterium]
MRLLVFTTLFPHPGAPHHGIFVLERLRHWIEATGGSAVVIAPVPYVPRALARGRFAEYAAVPFEESRAGIRVLHPRYLLLPKVSMSVAPWTLGRAGVAAARRLVAAGERFDLVDAHYLYPDGVAASFVARSLGLPLVVTARGTDVNLIPRHAIPRQWLRFLLRRADAAIAVADALRHEVVALAPAGFPCVTLRNGVDLAKFRPLERSVARARLRWPSDRPIVLSVGHLIERKGHHHLLAALPRLPAGTLLKLVGDGEWRTRLEAQARSLGIADRVEFCGRIAHDELHVAYSAADALALLSSREGWPNVLLEALACGTPVVATKVFGTPEVIRDERVGRLVDAPEGEAPAPDAVAATLGELITSPPDRAHLRRYAEGHSWQETVRGMQSLFEQVVARHAVGASR